MSKNWLRQYQLLVGQAGREGVSIDNFTTTGLKVRFEITKSLMKEPNEAKFEIFNLNPKHALAFDEEYTDVTFKAGYADSIKVLFDGNIQYSSNYRDKTEWVTEVVCGDGDEFFRKAYVNKTYSAGTTDENIVDDIRQQFGAKLRKGVMQLTNLVGSLRGRTFSKSAQESLDEIARTNGCNWSIQDGELQMVRADAMINPDSAVVLTPDTGLLEAAERTDKGITARAFLNPAIQVNTAVKLDNSAMKTQSRNKKSITKKQRGRVVDLNPDGIYKVFKVRHSGDTRATDWMTEILCVGLGQSIPTGQTDRSPGVPVPGISGNDDQIVAAIRNIVADVPQLVQAHKFDEALARVTQADGLAKQITNNAKRQSMQAKLRTMRQQIQMDKTLGHD
jgi:hypothetical protein